MDALIQRMHSIRKSLGLRAAAGYLRNRQVDFAEAHYLLLGSAPRK
ncbi:hypothetical protein [Variovorax paradoxus]|nr:hypothetical protein [Variovorax paradoxus]